MNGLSWLAVLGVACTGDGEGSSPRPDRDPPADTGPATVDGADEPGEVEVETVTGIELDPSAIFALDQVHTLEISLGPELRQALREDPYTYVETDIVFDDRPLDSVGVRLKGKIGSFRPLSEKAAFKIDFNRFVAGLTLDGLKRLHVDNMVQDHSQLHDRVANEAYRMAGVPAPRVGYAWVTVDGEDYGVYALVEEYDKTFLEDRFDEPDGNLYDGDYWIDPAGNYVLLDFNEETQEYFDLDAGTDVDLADVRAVTEVVSATCGGDGFDEAIDEVVDYAAFLRFWAMEAFVGQWDGYSANVNNYRFYFDPSRDGRAVFMPWDHGNAFQEVSLTGPKGLLADCCMDDAGCKSRILAEVEDACAALDIDALVEVLDTTAATIGPYVQADPRIDVTFSVVLQHQNAVRTWLGARCAQLAGESDL